MATDRYEGFRSALQTTGFSCHALVYRPQRQLLAEWLVARLRALPRPLACYVLDDPLAADVIDLCLTNGWRVPEDIAVMGNGNIELACE